MSRPSTLAHGFLGRRCVCRAGGDLRHRLRCRLQDVRALLVHPSSLRNTGPESTVLAAAAAALALPQQGVAGFARGSACVSGGGGRLRRPGAVAGEGRV